jgi:hypothetical protein
METIGSEEEFASEPARCGSESSIPISERILVGLWKPEIYVDSTRALIAISEKR